MTDRDMVSKAEVLDIYAELYDEFDDAPGIIKVLHKVCDKLKRLQPQEPVEPKLVGVNTWTCGECGALLGWEEFTRSGLELIKYKFCPECGRKVKWNA